MGILNVGLDSVADSRVLSRTRDRVARGRGLVDEGADIVDIGAISGRTDTPTISEQEEIAVLVPVVRELAGDGVPVSVDTWRPDVVQAVLEAGAAVINDVSGLADPRVARLVADAGAGLVIMHTRAAPKERHFPGYGDPMADVLDFLGERITLAREQGVAGEQIVVDPGLDYTKTPRESIAVLRRLDELQRFERPILLAVSRKYFLGMLTDRPPERRLGGTLAAIDFGLGKGANILRVHDVSEVAAFVAVRRALPLEEDLALEGDPDDETLKWIPPKGPPGSDVAARMSDQLAYILDTTLEAAQAMCAADPRATYDVDAMLEELRAIVGADSTLSPAQVVAAVLREDGVTDWPDSWEADLRDLDAAWATYLRTRD